MFRWPPTLDAYPIFFASKSVSNPYARRAFAVELISQLRKYGFARVRNHGIAPTTIQRLFKYVCINSVLRIRLQIVHFFFITVREKPLIELICLQHRRFFNLPLSAKLSVRHPGGEAPARGYSPWAYEKTAILRPDLHTAPNLNPDATTTREPTLPLNLTPSQDANILADLGTHTSKPLLDAREQFAIGPLRDTEFPTPQLAEEFLPNFNTETRKAYLEIGETCRVLVDVIEEGLDAPTGSISGRTSGGEGAELNLNFYPDVEKNVLQSSGMNTQANKNETNDEVVMRRIWPHSDLGVVSALLQDEIGASGLELEARESGESVFAPLSIEQEGDIVLLVSDTLERWTNGYLRAAVHRVGLPPTISLSNAPSVSEKAHVPERRSAVMFYRAPPTMTLGPLPHFVSADNPARYEDVTAEEYLKRHNKWLY